MLSKSVGLALALMAPLAQVTGLVRGSTAATGPAGHYQMGGLPDGTYTVCFGLGGFSVTRPNAGEDDLDSDAEQVNGCTRPVNLGPDNRDNPTVDAGVIAPGSR